MSFAPTLIPLVLIPTTFLFILLIVLIAKSPRTGAWLVGGLVFLTPVLLWIGLRAGFLADPRALPMVLVPATFLFVLLMVLLGKTPRVGAGMIVALLLMDVITVGSFFVMGRALRHRASYMTVGDVRSQWREIETAHGVERVQVWEDPAGGIHRLGSSSLATTRQANPTPPAPPQAPAPIWSEGVEQEFEADVYPSGLAAATALGRRTAGPIRAMAGDPDAPIKVVLFQESNDRSLVSALGRAMEKELPGVQYAIEADLRNIYPGEVGLTLRIDTAHQAVAMVEGASVAIINPQESLRMVAAPFTEGRRASAEARFIDKPWVENFSAFVGERPNEHYIVARSNGTCTSESEANQQALDDARARLTEAVGRQTKHGLAELAQAAISTTDVLNGGFVADRFVQSFDTSTGKVWRQALLINVSGPKLTALAQQKARESRATEMSWARMGLSVVGVLVLIGVIYFFLNLATMGYYEWSLRIAGAVLAIVAIVSILMIVK